MNKIQKRISRGAKKIHKQLEGTQSLYKSKKILRLVIKAYKEEKQYV